MKVILLENSHRDAEIDGCTSDAGSKCNDHLGVSGTHDV
jgi:hypothetical protein